MNKPCFSPEVQENERIAHNLSSEELVGIIEKCWENDVPIGIYCPD